VNYLITLDQKDILSLRDQDTKEIVIEDDEGREVCRFKVLTPREFLNELQAKGYFFDFSFFLIRYLDKMGRLIYLL